MRNHAPAAGAFVFACFAAAASLADEHEAAFTEEFPLKSCHFTPWGGNAYFKLRPGSQSYLSNSRCVGAGECDELEEVWITAKDEVRKIPLDIDGRQRVVWTRVVEEYETVDGELEEVSRNFFATCLPMLDVYYFGEEVDIYEEGEIVSSEGAWLAGRNGARPGIIMPDQAFLLGARYFQEIAPEDMALDRAEHVAMGLTVEVPAGVFEDCVKVLETTPLDPEEESIKVYCSGVGLVIDEDLELMAVYERRRGHK